MKKTGWTADAQAGLHNHSETAGAGFLFQISRLLGIGAVDRTGDQIEGLDYFAVIFKRRAIVIGASLFCALIGMAIGLSSTPQFTATNMAVPSVDDAGQGAAGALSGLSFLTGKAPGSKKDTAVALLGARNTFEQFIRQNKLLPILFSDRWDPVHRNWKDGVRPPALEDGYIRLKGITKIEQDTTANLVRVSVTWKDAPTAASWANGLTALVNHKMQSTAIARSDRMIAYLYSELAKIENQSIHTNIANLIEEQIKSRMLAKSNADYALEIIDPALPTKAKSSLGAGILTISGLLFGFIISIPLAFLLEAMGARKRRKPPEGA